MPSSDKDRKVNGLSTATSPYLLQHQYNPVDWLPWGPEALQRAKDEHKPILISIGYAACHWCHVMAHESFENPDIAEIMNNHFINIKVDREERPDLDTIYQSSLALLGESGGWPLTMFLTPNGEPFWGGTYFPPTARFGRPGFPDVLLGISAAYTTEPDKVQKNVEALRKGLGHLSRASSGQGVDPELRQAIAEQITRQFDPFEGGMGGAPKFPQPAILLFLWQRWKASRVAPLRNAVELTLTKMCQGGIYDHLGGGFARYSVDNRWLVPHFEKMLYDNAQLLHCLTWAWQDSGNDLYRQRAEETVTWLLREMMAEDSNGRPCGAFASALDADSEGEEGKFYVWDEAEIDRLLGGEAPLFKASYNVTAEGNWEGKTILNRSHDLELKDRETEERLAACRQILLQARNKRIWPSWDDKVLADWNGLTIAALTRAALAFDKEDWLEAAKKAFDFVLEHMEENGRLHHSWRRGKGANPATLDDYSFLCEAAFQLYEATGEETYITKARDWITVLQDHYWDSEEGGYFFTADDTRDVILRSKTAFDNATPNGNSILLGVLSKLYFLTGEQSFLEHGEELVKAFSGGLNKQGMAMPTLLFNSELIENAVQIVIVGEQDTKETKTFIAIAQRQCLPHRILQVLSDTSGLPHNHPAKNKEAINGKTTAYICRGQSCSLPINDEQEFMKSLGEYV